MMLFYVLEYSNGNLEAIIDEPCPCGSMHRYSNCCYKPPMDATIVERVMLEDDEKSDLWVAEQVAEMLKRHIKEPENTKVIYDYD